jgi:hypothetical protein
MQDEVSRLVSIDGLVVTGVVELAEQLELEVEQTLDEARCRWCGRGSLTLKDRPVVRFARSPRRRPCDVAVVAQAPVLFARRAGGR